MLPTTFRLSAAVLVAAVAGHARAADPPAAGREYLDFIKKQASDLRSGDKPITTREQAQTRNRELRLKLLAAWGGFPTEAAALDPLTHGELKRDEYRVEKVTFQTRPGVRMTANAYVPNRPGKLPAILMVHGHWQGAKQDPTVQARCIGAAKLGFFVLCVDAFGAGERGVGTALGEYHGEMTAATLLPVGLPLSGLQVYENTRAVDYLLTRPEVDRERIGITGASGGGNQTMYAGAWDERLKCVVPVCSVGNYQAYLGAACCMCEVVPGALTFTEESGLLAMVAPRALMVISATKDAFQFSVDEAKKSLALADPVFKLSGKPGNIRHAIFESPHDYSKAMREEMYGWMTLHLKGEGDGSPIREPEFKTEDPETLRCYPGETRPKDWMTIPQFAAAEGKKLLAARTPPGSVEAWAKESEARRASLIGKVFGGFPKAGPLKPQVIPTGHGSSYRLEFEAEPGVSLTAVVEPGKPDAPLAIILNATGGAKASTSPTASGARTAGWTVAGLELRATGTRAWPSDKVRKTLDHNTAEWGLWIGRPLLGQWVVDTRRLLDALERQEGGLPRDVIVIGEGPAGLVALAAAATDKRITKVAAVGALASYITAEPYVGQRLGVMAPGILRDVGDIAHLAALAAPRRVVIAGAVGANGEALTGDRLQAAYRPAIHIWELLKAPKELVIQESANAAEVIAALK
jgi:cephalosporin-C deacetylase-like acetyl esterase